MNHFEERPTTAPNLKLLEVHQFHQPAMEILESMMEVHRLNLAKGGYDESKAAVKREDWRKRMQWKLKVSEKQAVLIEKSLGEHGCVEFMLTYVVPAKKVETKPKELDISEKFFCHDCKKFKGIPHNYRRYFVGDQVNFVQKGLAGGVATNQVGSIQSISGRMLEIATATRYIKQHVDSVTPVWAPSPLTYFTMGQCWCEIDPEYLPGGASCA